MASADAWRNTGPGTVLDEAQLRSLSRQVRDLVQNAHCHGEEPRASVDTFISTFRLVLRTCNEQQLSATHQVAAWNALSTFVDQTACSQRTTLRDVLWSAHLWQDTLRIFLVHGKTARPKSIKQLLDALTRSALSTKNDELSSSYRWKCYKSLLYAIHGLDVPEDWSLRPCMLLLSSLLRKDALTMDEIDHLLGNTSISTTVADLLEISMQLAVTGDNTSAAAQLLSTLLDKSESLVATPDNGSPAWAVSLVQLLRAHPESLDAFRQRLMPVLFARNKSGFLILINQLGIRQLLEPDSRSWLGEHDLRMLLAALQAGRECGLAIVSDERAAEDSQGLFLLPTTILQLLVQHADRSIRLAGLTLLIQAPVISQPIPERTYSILRANLPHLHADTDLNFRSELFALTQKLFDRIRASINKWPGENGQSMREYISWYRRFLFKELRPSASYQRHISALKCLSILTKTGLDAHLPVDSISKTARVGGDWSFNIQILDDGFVSLLLRLLLDPFDDVRGIAASILEVYCALGISSAQRQQLLKYQEVVERTMLASGRADQAETVAYLWSMRCIAAADDQQRLEMMQQIVEKIKAMLDIAKKDLSLAVQGSPLHGFLISLRYLLIRPEIQASLSDTTLSTLTDVSRDIWIIVKPILCDDAPEGFLPDDITEKSSASSKAVLSYCWRALKEASLLAESILLVTTPRKNELTAEIRSSLTELTFTELTQLRHRGAFSTVAQTWIQCCTLAQSSVQLTAMIERALLLIRKTTINTRRSAGMPSIICGILVADRSGRLFEDTFTTLDVIARGTVQPGMGDESSLPQVHAMNCLKDILKSTKLAVQSEQYVSRALKLAADSLPSRAWAIRNCGLMLFRAVIDRLLGTNDSFDDEFVSKNVMDFRQKPALLDQVVLLLPNDTTPITSEGVFPALQLLQHALLPDDRRSVVYKAIEILLGHESWLIRDKAARTLMTLMPADTACDMLEARLKQTDNTPRNAVHGLILCVKHLKRTISAGEVPDDTRAGVARVRSLAEATAATMSWGDLLLTQTTHSVRSAAGFGSTSGPETSAAFRLSTASAATMLLEVSGADAAQDWLLTSSRSLESMAQTPNVSSEKLLTSIEEWLSVCETATLQQNSMFAPEIVAEALGNMEAVFTIAHRHHQAKDILLRICLSLYTLMQADDEDIRTAAATPTVRILSLRKHDFLLGGLEPIVASQKLLGFMLAEYSDLPTFVLACFDRAFDLHASTPDAIRKQLHADSLQDTALFAQEKQNLYIDETLEAKIWSRVAHRLAPADIEPSLLSKLTEMVDVGLDLLIARAEATEPGVSDWSTNEAVFVLGLRILYGAETLQLFSQKQVKLSLRPSSLRERILTLQAAAERSALHPVWRIELDRIARMAAVGSFSAIQTLVNGVIGRLTTATTLS